MMRTLRLNPARIVLGLLWLAVAAGALAGPPTEDGAGSRPSSSKPSDREPPQVDLVTAPMRLSIQDAVRRALRGSGAGALPGSDGTREARPGSPVVEARQAQALAALSRVRAARAETRLQVSGTAYFSASSMGAILSTPPGVVGPTNLYAVPPAPHADADLMVMVPIWTGGRLSAGIRAAEAEAAAASIDVATVEADVALEVRSAYRRALWTQAAAETFGDRVRAETEHVRITRERYEAGKAPKVDLLRADAELADAEQMRANAVRDVEIALVDLRAALGIASRAPLELTDSLAFEPGPSVPEDGVQYALSHRSELRAAQARIQRSEADVDHAAAASRPQVYGIAMADANVTRRRQAGGGTLIGVTVGLPLLDGGMRRADRDDAEARLAQMRADERSIRIRIESEVERATLEVTTAAQNATRSESAVNAAEEQARIAALRYESGKAVAVETLDAQNALTRARLNHLQALYESSMARDRLARAMGTPLLPTPLEATTRSTSRREP